MGLRCKDCGKNASHTIEYLRGSTQVKLEFCSGCVKPAMNFVVLNIPCKDLKLNGLDYIKPAPKVKRRKARKTKQEKKGEWLGPKRAETTDPFAAKPAHMSYVQ